CRRWTAGALGRDMVGNRHAGLRSPIRLVVRADAAAAVPLRAPRSLEAAGARGGFLVTFGGAGEEGGALGAGRGVARSCGGAGQAALLEPARQEAAPPALPRLTPQRPPDTADSELACRPRCPEHSTAVYRMDRLQSLMTPLAFSGLPNWSGQEQPASSTKIIN